MICITAPLANVYDRVFFVKSQALPVAEIVVVEVGTLGTAAAGDVLLVAVAGVAGVVGTDGVEAITASVVPI